MSSRTVQMKLAEMKEADVDFISLVQTGANGQPIKRLKSDGEGESDMINVRRIFKGDEAEEGDNPELLAIVVSESGDLDAAKTICKAAEIEIAEEREIEGGTLLMTDKDNTVDTGSETTVVERLTEEMAVVCKVSKTFAPFDGGTNFTEAAKGQGYFPALRGALETFGEVAFNIMAESKSPDEAATAVKQATKEFGSLVTSMTAALPISVFKMADVIQKITTAKKADKVIVNVNAILSPPSPANAINPDPKQAEFESADGVDTGASQSVNKDADADADDADAAAAADADGADGADDVDGDGADGAADDASDGSQGNEEITQVLKAIADLAGTVEKTNERLEEVAEQAADTQKAADAAQAAVNGTVVSEPPTDRAKSSGKRGRNSGGIPLMDTGMGRGAQRSR